MTLNEIIAAALSELGRGHDAQSVDAYRAKFTMYANDALCDLAASFKLMRTEKQCIDGSTIDMFELERPCLKINAITQDGVPLRFSFMEASGIAVLRATGFVDVTYRYVPKKLVSPSDIPEVPEYMHGLIVLYVAGRERMSGDRSTQGASEPYMGMYEAQKMRILSAMSADYVIEHKW